MKQVLQSLKNGMTEVAEVPVPNVAPGHLLVKTSRTLISAGTERMLIEFGKSGWLERARQHPDKVKLVLDKIRADGFVPAFEAVSGRLDQPLALGYSNVGRVIEIGAGVTGFKIGQRVISNGKHADIVNVPANLCTVVPDSVPDDIAVFTVLGAVGLQGIRLAKPTLGEAVVVIGLGLIGLITVQLLLGQGCRVLGMDFDPEKTALAHQFGAEVLDLSTGQDPLGVAAEFSRDRGVDAVLITAATKSNEPLRQAAQMCRKRGRIVLVGVSGLELSRDDFYEKELSFQVSCSYGPGRYDPRYEREGIDYPVGFVRWTAQRNFEAVLDQICKGSLAIEPLITHKFAIEDAEQAYAIVTGDVPSLGIVLTYSESEHARYCRTIQLSSASDLEHRSVTSSNTGKVAVSFIGAGNYAFSALIPAFKSGGAKLRIVASRGGLSGYQAARKYKFDETTTDIDRVLKDSDTDVAVIATRHNNHASTVIQALQAGKHVFVEKPLCLTLNELDNIREGYLSSKILMVGFNRRFAPHVVKMKSLLSEVNSPKALVMTINAGSLPADHWAKDLTIGGGRVVGEVCHFIDLMRFLVGCRITDFSLGRMDKGAGDTLTVNLSFVDGSIGTIHYFANGPKSFPKERVEVFASGAVLRLDNFRMLTGFGWPNFKKMHLWRQDKGQLGCVTAFLQAIEFGTQSPIPLDEIFEVSQISIELAHQ